MRGVERSRLGVLGPGVPEGSVGTFCASRKLELPPVPSAGGEARGVGRVDPPWSPGWVGRLRGPVAAVVMGALGGCAVAPGVPTESLAEDDGVVLDVDAMRLGGTGRFGFSYGADEAVVTFRTHVDASRLGSEASRRTFEARLEAAVAGFDEAAEIVLTDPSTGETKTAQLRFRLELLDSAEGAHKLTEAYPGSSVQPSGPLARVASVTVGRVQLPIEPEGCPQTVFAHELGHVFGMPDEYARGGFLGLVNRLALGETKHHDDRRALMNATCGTELRARYFEPFAELLEQVHAERGEDVEAHVVLRKANHGAHQTVAERRDSIRRRLEQLRSR